MPVISISSKGLCWLRNLASPRAPLDTIHTGALAYIPLVLFDCF
jgi:hypothetical protein